MFGISSNPIAGQGSNYFIQTEPAVASQPNGSQTTTNVGRDELTAILNVMDDEDLSMETKTELLEIALNAGMKLD